MNSEVWSWCFAWPWFYQLGHVFQLEMEFWNIATNCKECVCLGTFFQIHKVWFLWLFGGGKKLPEQYAVGSLIISGYGFTGSPSLFCSLGVRDDLTLRIRPTVVILKIYTSDFNLLCTQLHLDHGLSQMNWTSTRFSQKELPYKLTFTILSMRSCALITLDISLRRTLETTSSQERHVILKMSSKQNPTNRKIRCQSGFRHWRGKTRAN